MKHYAVLCVCVLIFVACNKNQDAVSPQPREAEKQNCTFGLTEFNLSKRAPNFSNETAKGKPTIHTSNGGGNGNGGGGNGNGGNGGGGSTPSGASVIFLDFDGHTVSNTMWNVYGTFTCAPANLTQAEINEVFQRIATDFMPFNVTVTTDESIYNNANIYKRTRVVITESWEWYGQAGGVAYLNSFTWGDNTPCFVFSSLLNYNVKNIAEAASHEAGHTLGLRHQSVYDANGAKLSEYNWGVGSGETGWAPIMGAGYNRNLTLWHNGPNSISPTSYQNEVAIINTIVGMAADDHANGISGATVLSSSTTGVINSNTDTDFFSISLSGTKSIVAAPQNVGANNNGGNLDLVLRIYNSQGNLIATIDDSSILSATATLTAGNYYIAVGTVGNSYATTYGMLSKYNISIN